MRIVGVLSWFDESPSWLAAAVAGMGRIVDTIVAVDGAYALYPGARARSLPQQGEAVMIAAEAAGVGCIIHRPRDVWFGNEVEKRNHTLDLAGTVCDEDDWVIVFDADLHMLQCNPALIRHELESTDCVVATYTVLDGKDFLADDKLADYVKHRPIDSEWTTRTRDIYRWHPTLRYGPLHWSVSRRLDGETVWLRGPFEERYQADPLRLDASLVCYHRTMDRMRSRRETADAYYQIRNKLNIEPRDRLDAEAKRLRKEAGVPEPKQETPRSRGVVVTEDADAVS